MTSSGMLTDRALSVSSERTLDNIDAIPSVRNTPQHSPGSMDNIGFSAGSSRPPHHGRTSPVSDEDDGDKQPPPFPPAKTKVSWKTSPVSETSHEKTKQQFFYGHDSEHRPEERSGHRLMPEVVTGTDSSPVRRLKRKENEQPKYERELSDAYIDSISRTPRYELGRHNTYDELLSTMNSDDPFKGDYQPSGISPRDKSKKPPRKEKKTKQDRSPSVSREGTSDYLPLEAVSLKKRKKKRTSQVNDSMESTTSSFHIQANTNKAFEVATTRGKQEKRHEADKESLKSNGTYTLKDSLRASLTNLTAPILKKINKFPTTKVDSYLDSHVEIDQIGFAKFIKEHHMIQRECSAYVRNKQSKEGKCCCGRELQWHELKLHKDLRQEVFNNDGHIWHHKTHSEKLPCDSFGEVQFQGFGQEAGNSPYIRLSPCSDQEVVWNLMTQQWKLPIPKLLISVTGGAQRFDLSPKLKSVFKKGLINAATSTGAWIITGGTATGVMQFVGEAVRDHLITLGSQNNSVVAIGVTTWGCLANKEALDGEGDEGLFPATYSFEDVEEIKGKGVPLDHNHTHFLLVDDGTEGKFGGEIEFRAGLERYVSEKVETGVAETQSVNVPVVMLVVEGGVNTMKTVWEAAQQNIPVLTLNGSGRAADFIAYGYDLSRDMKNEDKSKLTMSFDEEMAEVARNKFAWKKTDNVENKIGELVKQLRDLLEKRKLINVFNLSEADTKDIDKAILFALLKANKTNAAAQLALALAWNRCDIARHEIFTIDNRHHWKKLSLYDAMFTALVQDRVDFVQLFLENGVNLKKFLSIETLWNLYGNILKDESDPMSQTINNMLVYLKQSWKNYLCCIPTETTGQDPNLLFLVGKLLVHLIGDENMNHYTDEKYIVKEKFPQMRWLQGNHAQGNGKFGESTLTRYHSADAHKFYKRKRVEYDFSGAERELFYWAILLNRREMAKMFWRSGDDQLGAALIACSILKALSEMADDDEELELSQDLLDHANMYEDLAYGVLSECYKRDKKLAHQLLVRRLEQYGKATLFALADANTLMKFMGHTCCQTKLNLIWKGRMALYTQTWKIILSLLLPVFVPMIKFTTNQSMIDDHVLKDDFDDLDTENDDAVNDEVKVIDGQKGKIKPSGNGDGGPDDEVFVRSKSRRKKAGKKKLYKVQMFSNTRTDSIGVLDAFYFFYTAPVTVFAVNTISYMVFLALFTYFILTDFHPHTPSVIEYVVWGWTITMALEELRQILSNDKRSIWFKLRDWFGSMWNKFDLAMYVIFVLSVILRYWLTGENFVYARVFYSMTLAMYFLRFMQNFFVEKNIGPKVIMIRNMIVDLVFFLGIVLVFMLSFGVMYQANLFPNSEPSWRLLKNLLYIPYWQMYGELFLEDLEGEDPGGCTNNETIWRANDGKDRCPEQNALIPFLGAVYLILTNILLVNLLIAMFSYTFQMVQDKSEQVWRYYRYSLVYEFYMRPVFCPPLIVLNHGYRSLQWVIRKGCSGRKYHNEFKLSLDHKDNNRLTLFVRSATEAYLTTTHKAAKEELSYKVTDTAQRIEKVIEELDNIKDHVRFTNIKHASLEDTIGRPTTAEPIDHVEHKSLLSARTQSNLQATVESLEDRMNQLTEQISQTNLNTAHMMQMMQMVLAQQRPRPIQPEISNVNQYGEPANDQSEI